MKPADFHPADFAAGRQHFLTLEVETSAGIISLAVLLCLLLLSIWSWGIFLYKWWTFRRAAKQSAQFLEVFRRSNKFSEVQAVCRSLGDSPLVGLFQTGYAELTAPLVGLIVNTNAEFAR